VKDGAAKYVHNFLDLEYSYVGGEKKLPTWRRRKVMKGDERWVKKESLEWGCLWRGLSTKVPLTRR
jgi:hypothetical protein